MPVSKSIELHGALKVNAGDCVCATFPSGQTVMKLEEAYTSGADVSRSFTIADAVTWQDLLAGTNITQVAFLVLKVRGGSVELRRTVGTNVDQIIPVSDTEIWVSRTQRATALSIRGNADIELFIGGV